MPSSFSPHTPLSQRTRIKVCGLTRESDVEAAVMAGVDAVGFVLYPKSPRYVSVACAAELARRLPPFVTPVALVVNAADDLIKAVKEELPQALLQFHGDESPDQCQAHAGARAYVRAARMSSGFNLLDFARQHAGAQAMLVDAFVEGYGGGGHTFDWSLLPSGGLNCPLILSGGLNAQNVGEGIRGVRPWAVDVSSGVEASKGIKDAGLINEFCRAVRAADQFLAEVA